MQDEGLVSMGIMYNIVNGDKLRIPNEMESSILDWLDKHKEDVYRVNVDNLEKKVNHAYQIYNIPLSKMSERLGRKNHYVYKAIYKAKYQCGGMINVEIADRIEKVVDEMVREKKIERNI